MGMLTRTPGGAWCHHSHRSQYLKTRTKSLPKPVKVRSDGRVDVRQNLVLASSGGPDSQVTHERIA